MACRAGSPSALDINERARVTFDMASFDSRGHHRRSSRLQNWDYRSAAAYFITICTHLRVRTFDNPSWAAAATDAWLAIPVHSSRVVLDAWVLMPNHLHGILVLTDDDGQAITDAPFDLSQVAFGTAMNPTGLINAPSGSLGAIIGSYKSVVTRRINQLRQLPGGRIWQRGYYERVIRNSDELDRIRAYVHDNPARWATTDDELNVLLTRMNLRQ
jgi:REP element-mobilizing transposase RayT